MATEIRKTTSGFSIKDDSTLTVYHQPAIAKVFEKAGAALGIDIYGGSSHHRENLTIPTDGLSINGTPFSGTYTELVALLSTTVFS